MSLAESLELRKGLNRLLAWLLGHEVCARWLRLLQQSARGAADERSSVVVVRSAQQRLALHVDEVLGYLDVVVKPLGPQLARMPGLAGMTLLPAGKPALIYNPVALAALYGEAARLATAQALQAPEAIGAAAEPADEAAPATEDHAEAALQRAALHEALGRLSARDREVVALRFHAGLETAEVAGVLGVSRSNAATLLHRAITKLRETLDAR